MSDVSSTIRIDDGFTQPLQDLTKAAIEASDKVETLKDSLEGLANVDLEEFSDYFDAAMLMAGKRFDNLVKRISKSATDQANKIAKHIKQTTNNIRFEVLYVTSFIENKVDLFSRKIMFSIKWKALYLSDLIRGKIDEISKQGAKAFAKSELKRFSENIGKLIGYVEGSFSRLHKIIPIIGNDLKKSFLSGIYQIPGKVEGVFSKTLKWSNILKKALSAGKNAIGDALSKEVTKNKLISLLRNEINGYQRYRNIIWDKQDALKNVPQKLNMADKIGRRGNILARRLEVAGFDKAAKFLYGKSDALIGNYGVKPQTIADPTVFGYVRQRAVEVKAIVSNNFKGGFAKGVEWLKSTEVYKITKDIALDFGKMVGMSIITDMTLAALYKFKDKLIGLVQSTRVAIQNSLEEVSTRDKLRSIYGDAGNGAFEHSFGLANELGESSSMISQLSQSALSVGIGTKSFDKIMRLSDKIGKLKLGSSTEEVASELISNVYNGGDIEQLSSVLGLNKELTKVLEKSDYKKLIQKGDLDEALKIANEIAEQAGYTNDKYEIASNTLSQNYKKIENVLSNVKRKLSEIYVQSLSPVVEKFRKFLESEKVQIAIRLLEKGIRRLGSFVSDLLSSIMDNIGTIGAIFGVAIISKLYLALRSIQGTLAMLPIIKSGLTWILTKLGAKGILGALSKITVKTVGWAAIKVAGPWVAAGAAVAGITYGVYKLSGTTKSFSEWLKGALAAGYQGAKNVFENIFIFFDRVAGYIKALPELLKAAFEDLENSLKTFVRKTNFKLGKKQYKYEAVSEKELATMSKDEKDKLWKYAGVYIRKKEIKEGDEDLSYTSKTDEVLNRIQKNQMKYIDVTKGVGKALETGGASLLEDLKKLLGIQNKKQDGVEEKLNGIKQDTHGLASSMSQEDELSWMKAFSDRQIMSSYNSSTSNNSTINLNGVSQNTMAEAYRRNRSTIPSRSML